MNVAAMIVGALCGVGIAFLLGPLINDLLDRWFR